MELYLQCIHYDRRGHNDMKIKSTLISYVLVLLI